MKTDAVSDPDPRLRALAGLLAEHSVQTLILTHAGTRLEVRSRATDLPRELEKIAREGGEIEAPELGLTIRFVGADVRCECSDPTVSIAILKALAPP